MTAAAFPALRRFTVAEYHAMAEAGVFGPGERVELIDGHITPISPVGTLHFITVNYLNQCLTEGLLRAKRRDVLVSVQGPVQVDDWGEPEPDVALLRDTYADEGRVARAADALLLVEVAVSTEQFDREVKLPRYALAGIPEVWIVLPEARRVEVYRAPEGSAYRTKATLGDGEAVAVAALPEVAPVEVTRILPRHASGDGTAQQM